MNHITVLMSTYNGEMYLQEQIESLLSQENILVDILVRDDGSSDKTQEILNKYQRQGKLKWYTGENLKPAKSFMDLVYNAPESDYYAFCDQDDIWLSDKLEIAVEKLKAFSKDIPALYYGRPRLVDENLKMIKQSEIALEHMLTFKSAIINSHATGCTMVFNRELIKKVQMVRPEYVDMHDSWIHKVCMLFNGNVYFDPDVHILYRQHQNNVIGITTSSKTRIKKHFQSLRNKECTRSRVVISLYDCYHEYMNEDQKEICYNIRNYQTSFKDKLKLLFNSSIRTDYFRRNLLFRMAVLLNAY